MVRYALSKLFRYIFHPSAIRNSKLHPTAKVGTDCNIVNCSMGRYSYIGSNTNVSMTTVGAFTSISANCSIGGGAHPIDWVSTSPAFTDARSILRVNIVPNHFEPHKQTEIGNDVWIGTHVLIKAGVRIGDGAIIGMGSVVTKDVGPYEIWAGNPAKCIKKRFNDEIIDGLRKSKWWEYDVEKLQSLGASMTDPEAFINRVEEET